MVASSLNHVSVVADDLEASRRFYEDVFGMESVPTANFEVPVAWLSCGEQQLHLFERPAESPQYHHFGLTVDEFEPVYDAAVERDCFDDWDDDSIAHLYELPDGAVQMYLRDPAGNLVEVNWPDVESLPERIRAQVVDRRDLVAQDGDAARATLGLGEE